MTKKLTYQWLMVHFSDEKGRKPITNYFVYIPDHEDCSYEDWRGRMVKEATIKYGLANNTESVQTDSESIDRPPREWLKRAVLRLMTEMNKMHDFLEVLKDSGGNETDVTLN